MFIHQGFIYKSKTLFTLSCEGLFDRNLSCTFQDCFILFSSLSFAWTFLVIMLSNFRCILKGVFTQNENSFSPSCHSKILYFFWHNGHDALFHGFERLKICFFHYFVSLLRPYNKSVRGKDHYLSESLPLKAMHIQIRCHDWLQSTSKQALDIKSGITSGC